jgi:selenide, water dikinase
MLPGYVSGVYSFEDCHIDLSKLATFARARLVNAKCTGINRAARTISFEDRPPIHYDCLSIDIGIMPNVDDIPGLGHVTPVKPIDGYVLWSQS